MGDPLCAPTEKDMQGIRLQDNTAIKVEADDSVLFDLSASGFLFLAIGRSGLDPLFIMLDWDEIDDTHSVLCKMLNVGKCCM